MQNIVQHSPRANQAGDRTKGAVKMSQQRPISGGLSSLSTDDVAQVTGGYVEDIWYGTEYSGWRPIGSNPMPGRAASVAVALNPQPLLPKSFF